MYACSEAMQDKRCGLVGGELSVVKRCWFDGVGLPLLVVSNLGLV